MIYSWGVEIILTAAGINVPTPRKNDVWYRDELENRRVIILQVDVNLTFLDGRRGEDVVKDAQRWDGRPTAQFQYSCFCTLGTIIDATEIGGEV